MVAVEGLSKRYGRTLALDSVDLTVRAGEMFALLGPNGAGKTTLVHILCTILRPDNGSAKIDGVDVERKPMLARSSLGVVFQESTLDDRLTVFENLEFHGMLYGVPRRLRRKRIDEMLAVVELDAWRGHVVRELSSGMKRRLEIARALVHDARLLFLDEPTVGLDAQSRERIWEYIAQLRKDRDLTVLVTTHYIAEVEDCDTICIIDNGSILAEGPPSDLKKEHGQRVLRVQPKDEDADRAISAAYADSLLSTADELVIRFDDDTFVERFLAHFGTDVRSLTVEIPTLESVFLSLTGRDLRDEVASARDRTLAFGKRGGEHTR